MSRVHMRHTIHWLCFESIRAHKSSPELTLLREDHLPYLVLGSFDKKSDFRHSKSQQGIAPGAHRRGESGNQRENYKVRDIHERFLNFAAYRYRLQPDSNQSTFLPPEGY
jgi:hypothetical protein